MAHSLGVCSGDMMLCCDYVGENTGTKTTLVRNHNLIEYVSDLMALLIASNLMMSETGLAITDLRALDDIGINDVTLKYPGRNVDVVWFAKGMFQIVVFQGSEIQEIHIEKDLFVIFKYALRTVIHVLKYMRVHSWHELQAGEILPELNSPG